MQKVYRYVSVSEQATELRQNNKVFQGLIMFSIAEVMGAVVWVTAASILALAIGSVVEHYIARNVGQAESKQLARL